MRAPAYRVRFGTGYGNDLSAGVAFEVELRLTILKKKPVPGTREDWKSSCPVICASRIAFEGSICFAGFETNLAANVSVRPSPKPKAFVSAVQPAAASVGDFQVTHSRTPSALQHDHSSCARGHHRHDTAFIIGIVRPASSAAWVRQGYPSCWPKVPPWWRQWCKMFA
jgi:hypothetical protein